MKLTLILMTTTLLNVSAKGLSQTITFRCKNCSFEQVFSAIESQCGYTVAYDGNLLKNANKVSIQASNEPLKKFLESLFEKQPFNYSIKNTTIFISAKTSKALTEEPIPTVSYDTTKHMRGQVYSADNQPLSGATVFIKNKNKSRITDALGVFLIDVAIGDELSISYVGYTTKLIKVSSIDMGKGYFNIVLAPAVALLDETVVQAFGTTTRRDNVGAISTVKSSTIETQPVTNVLQALSGQVPGLNVVSTNGGPGSMVLTQIRGQNSLANKADKVVSTFDQPLFVVDGVPMPLQNNPLIGSSLTSTSLSGASYWQGLTGMSPLNGLNPLDIENVSVLKDADATSIFGSQGSNGVILITTKRAKSGKELLSISLNSGYNKATRTTPMLNTEQYLAMRQEAVESSKVTPNPYTDPDLLVFDQNKYTNWMKEFYGGTARRTNLYVSLSGGSISNNFMLSGGYTKETYNFPGDMAENRYSLHSAFTHKSNDQKFKLDFGTDFSYDRNSNSGEPAALIGFTLAPNFPDLIDSTGKPVWNYKGYHFGNYQSNPLATLYKIALSQTYFLNTHVLASYQLLPSLGLSVNAGYGRQSEDFYNAIPISAQDPQFGPLGIAGFQNRNTDVINIVPQLDFRQTISRGVLTALVGGTYKKNYSNGTSLNGYGYTSDAMLGSISGATSIDASNSGSYYKYTAVFARLNYKWDGKYILNLTGNRNGSSNFGPDKRFGNFGSVGAGWILTEEGWLKNKIGFLSFAKIAANYGTSGSDGVAPYQYQPNWGRAGSYPYQGNAGYIPLNPLNPVYAWASNKKFNEQLDLGFLNDRILLNFTLYQNSTDNQLVSYKQPIQTGFDAIVANAPYTVDNKGWEATISTNNITKKRFRWTTNLNLSRNRNTLAAFPGLESTAYASSYIVGKSLTTQQLFPYAGVNTETGLFEVYKADGTKTSMPADFSGFNKLGGDRTQLVELAPKIQGGLTNTIVFHDFSLSFFFQGSVQKGPSFLQNVYASGITKMPGSALVNEPAALQGLLWHQPGDVAEAQKLSVGWSASDGYKVYYAASAFASSTGAYVNASYIRLKNVALSYNLPERMLKKIAMKGCSFYANAQNLFLITNYKVGDPETLNIFTIPPQRTVVFGINASF